MLVSYSTLAAVCTRTCEPLIRANVYARVVPCLKDRKRQQRQHTPGPLRAGKRQGAAPGQHRAATTLFTRARQRQLHTRGKRCSAAGRSTKCDTERQPRIYRVRASGDDHLTRPETLSGNAMWKKLTTTPWRTEDARSDSRRRDRPVCCALCANPPQDIDSVAAEPIVGKECASTP